MKTIIATTLAVLFLSGCAGQYHIDQSKEDWESWVQKRHVKKQALNRSYCNGKDFGYYAELEDSFSFSCKEGGYIYLRKE